MRVLGVEKTADGLLDVMLRAQACGHQCRYFLQSFDPRKCPVGRGLVERVGDWRESVAWADLILLGSNDLPMMEIERRCQARGVPWIGGNQESAKWENDRLYGMEVMRKARIAVPPVREFRDYDSAITHVEKEGRPFYMKPCWPDADKALSCKTGVYQNPAYNLRKFKRQTGRPKGTFILQEPIEGVEMGVGGWFGPDGFAEGYEENWEFKKLCAGDIGPNTGEMGTVMRVVRQSKLADKILLPIEDQLHRTGYIGNIDTNAILDQYGDPHPLEFTVRFGWPSTNIEQALFDGDFIEFLAGLAVGKPPKGARRMNEVAVGVVLVLPPFPFPITDYEQVIGLPIYGMTDRIAENVHLAQAMGADGELRTAGDYVLVSTGVGETVTAARAKALRVIARLTLPASPYWRQDIGSRLRPGLDSLQEHGYATGLRYA